MSIVILKIWFIICSIALWWHWLCNLKSLTSVPL